MAILGILFIGVYVASIMGVGYIIFSPFKTTIASTPIHGKRFQLTDLFGFFLSFQLGFGAIRLFSPDLHWDRETVYIVTTALFFVAGLAWFYGLRVIWRTNITSAAKRIVLLGFVMPFGLAVPALSLWFLLIIDSTISFVVRLYCIAAATLLLRFLGIWVLAGRNDPASEIDEQQGSV